MRPILKKNFFSKLATRTLNVLAGVCQDFFMLQTSGAQNIAEKRYMKCTFCLGLVGVLYPLELELPAISGWSKNISPIFSDFTETS